MIRAGALAAALSLGGTVAAADPGHDAVADAAGSFVDAEGCAWQRIEIGDQVAWAALLGPLGAQLCDPAAARPAPMPGPETASRPVPDLVPDPVTEPATAATAATAAADPGGEALPAPPQDIAPPPAPVAERPAAARSPVTRTGSTARMPKFPAPGLYVQVAAFRDGVNALRTTEALQGAGLSVLRQDFARKDGQLRVLFAGPFPEPAAAGAALRQVRAMGFGDAFLWDAR